MSARYRTCERGPRLSPEAEREISAFCRDEALALVKHSHRHWQIRRESAVIADIWPTTGRYRVDGAGVTCRGDWRAILKDTIRVLDRLAEGTSRWRAADTSAIPPWEDEIAAQEDALNTNHLKEILSET